MKNPAIFLSCLLALSAATSSAAEQHKCYLISDEGNGVFRQDTSQYVSLSLDQEGVRSQIHVNGTDKDVTFSTCAGVKADGSNFSDWFETECKKLKSLDGSSFSYEYFLIGAYAGISPVIDQNYSMYETIKSTSESAGVKMPERTFVIYASGSPVYEFFCNRQETPPLP